MFSIEFISAHELMAAGDPSDARWTPVAGGPFVSFEMADAEAEWLSLDDDGRHVFRVVELKEEAA